MHGYYWDRQRLKNKLASFNGGQFLMETRLGDKNGMVFRGEIRDWSIPNINQKRVLVYFNWLCEQRFGIDEFFSQVSRWVLLKPKSPGFQFLTVDYTSYYFQRKRPDREERVKLWTPQDEVCRFFRKDDPTNLKQQGDEFLPCYQPEPDLGPDD